MTGLSVADFSQKLSNILGRPVIDETGIAGLFDFHFDYSDSENTAVAGVPTDTQLSVPLEDAPSIFTVLQDQFGLKLEPVNNQREVLIVDNVEKPSAN